MEEATTTTTTTEKFKEENRNPAFWLHFFLSEDQFKQEPLSMGDGDENLLRHYKFCFHCLRCDGSSNNRNSEKDGSTKSTLNDKENNTANETNKVTKMTSSSSDMNTPPPASLRRCTQCKCAYYCSRECQKAAWKKHKSSCLKIKELQEELDSDEMLSELAELEYLLEEEYIFIFKCEPQMQGGNYLAFRLDLADAIFELAYEVETSAELWNKALEHYLEVLRLDPYDIKQARFRVPFILLYLNRDDDAYCFCVHMLMLSEYLDVDTSCYTDDDDLAHTLNEDGNEWIMPKEDIADEEVLKYHIGSSPGDWLYPRKRDARLHPVFEYVCPDIPPTIWQHESHFFLPLFILKMRAAIEGVQRWYACKLIRHSSSRLVEHNLDPVLHLVEEYLLFEKPDYYQTDTEDKVNMEPSTPTTTAVMVENSVLQAWYMLAHLSTTHDDFLVPLLQEPALFESHRTVRELFIDVCTFLTLMEIEPSSLPWLGRDIYNTDHSFMFSPRDNNNLMLYANQLMIVWSLRLLHRIPTATTFMKRFFQTSNGAAFMEHLHKKVADFSGE